MRIAVLSPFVDRQHGTERALTELLLRLSQTYGHEIHLYSNRVNIPEFGTGNNISGDPAARVKVHLVPKLRGPHLFQFVFWLFANGLYRLRDSWFRGLRFDAVFSPGINTLDADVILVHAIFHRLRELQGSRASKGLRDLHRAAYYAFVGFLESSIYRRKKVRLAAVSRHTAEQLARYFARQDVAIIPNGVDAARFSPQLRLSLRPAKRAELGYSSRDRVLLLVGNDLRNKGLPALLEALATCPELPWKLCILGSDASSEFSTTLQQAPFLGRVTFAGETLDILSYYAAADIYVAPSLEDSFNLPALEAMACGVPVVLSTAAGMSEYITDGVNGLMLRDPKNVLELAASLRKLLRDESFCATLAQNALSTATGLSWDRHAAEMDALLTGKPAPRNNQ